MKRLTVLLLALTLATPAWSADQIKATLAELGETLSEEEEQVERLIAERPIAALASAFTLGIAIGFMLRRH